MEASGSQIGGRIKRLRRVRHLSQADLAAALGISPSYLNLIEHNRRKVTVPLLFSIAGYFGVEPGELVDHSEAANLDRDDLDRVRIPAMRGDQRVTHHMGLNERERRSAGAELEGQSWGGHGGACASRAAD